MIREIKCSVCEEIRQIKTLNTDEVYDIVIQPCHYCGAEPNPFNGMDRYDNDPVYSVATVVPCCKTCNYGKHTQNYQEFIRYLDNLVEFRTHNEEA